MYTFDAHNDTLMRLTEDVTLFAGSETGHVDLPRLQAGGVDAQIFAVFCEPHYRPGGSLQRALLMIDTFWSLAENHSEALEAVLWAEDLARLRQSKKIAALLSLEGGEPLGVAAANLNIMYRLGVRALTFTWNHRNNLGCGVGEEKHAGGLSAMGWEVLERMEQLGMVADVSHLAEPGFWDVLQGRTAVIASHSNAASVYRHRRNLTDEQLRALADKGGVVGVNFCPAFIQGGPEKDITLSDLVVHIEHLVNVMGAEGVGLGSDYDGIGSVPQGLEDAASFPNLAAALQKQGFAEQTVEKIMGGNFYRVFFEALPSQPRQELVK